MNRENNIDTLVQSRGNDDKIKRSRGGWLTLVDPIVIIRSVHC